MLALTIAVVLFLVCAAGFRLRAAWKNVDAMIAAHAGPATSSPRREPAGV